MNRIIDLRSDTLTKLHKKDVEDIDFNKIGDDCYGEDLYVKELEVYCANLFGKEAALFMPSGTMSNQIGLRCLAPQGGEVITEVGYHVNFFESSATSALGGLVLHPFHTKDGILTSTDILKAIRSKARWSSLYSEPKVVAIESSINTYGGKCFSLEEIKNIRKVCNDYNMNLYLDGARVLNACASLNIEPSKYVESIDMLNICLSKGLGAPFGSLLIGNHSDIEKAKHYRKWYGGALHQSGLMAGIALNKIKKWKRVTIEDNQNANLLGESISSSVNILYPVETNMVYVEVSNAKKIVQKLAQEGVLSIAWTDNQIRFICSSLVAEDEVKAASEIIKSNLIN